MFVKSTIILFIGYLLNDFALMLFPAIYYDMLHYNPIYIKTNGTVTQISNITQSIVYDDIEYSCTYSYQYNWSIDQSYTNNITITSDSLTNLADQTTELKNKSLVIYFNRYFVIKSCLDYPCTDGLLSISRKTSNSGILIYWLLKIIIMIGVGGLILHSTQGIEVINESCLTYCIPKSIWRFCLAVLTMTLILVEGWNLYFLWLFNPPNVSGYLETKGNVVDSILADDFWGSSTLGLTYNYSVNENNYQNNIVILANDFPLADDDFFSSSLVDIKSYYNFLQHTNISLPVYYNPQNPNISCLYGDYETLQTIWVIYELLSFPLIILVWIAINYLPNHQESSPDHRASSPDHHQAIAPTSSTYLLAPNLNLDLESSYIPADYLCRVCQEKKINATSQCGHGACLKCLNACKNNNGKCPICRAEITQITNLYL